MVGGILEPRKLAVLHLFIFQTFFYDFNIYYWNLSGKSRDCTSNTPPPPPKKKMVEVTDTEQLLISVNSQLLVLYKKSGHYAKKLHKCNISFLPA